MTPVLVFIALINILLPFIAGILDKKVFKSISEGTEDCVISEEFLVNIATRKKEVYEKIIYKRDAFKYYAEYSKIDTCSLVRVFSAFMHPVLGFIHFFDFELKRLSRFMVLSMSASFIAIGCAGYFRSYRPNEEREFDSNDVATGVVAGAILSILTLPLTPFLVGCLRSEIRVKPKRALDKQKISQLFEGGEQDLGPNVLYSSTSSAQSHLN